jgi:hypothetical protein
MHILDTGIMIILALIIFVPVYCIVRDILTSKTLHTAIGDTAHGLMILAGIAFILACIPSQG